MVRLVGERFVSTTKIVRYLLDASHPDGAPKAHFFFRFGFTMSDPDALLNAVSAHPDRNELIATERTGFGLKSVVQCRVRTPDGRDPCIRTVWMVDAGSTIQRFVTAYPAG